MSLCSPSSTSWNQLLPCARRRQGDAAEPLFFELVSAHSSLPNNSDNIVLSVAADHSYHDIEEEKESAESREAAEEEEKASKARQPPEAVAAEEAPGAKRKDSENSDEKDSEKTSKEAEEAEEAEEEAEATAEVEIYVNREPRKVYFVR
ncbi:hypothetical protein GCK72_003058 [Caenorhabditis remanei]|uniref:Uncharacterized protein n=1 Tax=Caenorhabditis remanei TaxID=31234 RepID=A0A6A5HYE0_CAERE|nr:hypothetical protein GCK72_003058 [Caenorhabditis remanei]KAF1771232.1 hypothetical protein GCK72_003058 [Caenorhabditis remanei]